MNKPQERVLVVENDTGICDVLVHQALQPAGYQVETAQEAGDAIKKAASFTPDVIIASLRLPGLSGKDLLAALASKNIQAPIIVLGERGCEEDIIQAFRLGAADCMIWPLREAEVVTAVDRAFKQVRARREREQLARQLKEANDELKKRLGELTLMISLGKAVVSITNQRTLFDKIIEGGVHITEADAGWLLIRNERQAESWILSAHRNLPKSLADNLFQPWDDSISGVVGISGETLSMHGEPMNRFKASHAGKAALVVPLKVKKEVIGLMTVVRKEDRPFSPANQYLLEAVADYASISLMNARLFRILEERVHAMQKAAETAQGSEHKKEGALQQLDTSLQAPLKAALEQSRWLLSTLTSKSNPPDQLQVDVVNSIHQNLQELEKVVGKIAAAGS